jgi:hypothetical protein
MPVRNRSTLRATIVQLASDFAEGVLEAVRNVSLEDLLAEAAGPSRPVATRPRAAQPEPGPKRKRGRRLARRSPADLARVVERVVALLAQHPKGLRSEELQAKLGLAAREMPRPLGDALATHRIIRRGEKRATTYFAGSAKAAKPQPLPEAKAKASKASGSKAARGKKARPGRPASKTAATRVAKAKRSSKAPKKAAAAPAKSAPNGAPASPTPGAPS